jgi:hypothetical protein
MNLIEEIHGGVRARISSEKARKLSQIKKLQQVQPGFD